MRGKGIEDGQAPQGRTATATSRVTGLLHPVGKMVVRAALKDAQAGFGKQRAHFVRGQRLGIEGYGDGRAVPERFRPRGQGKAQQRFQGHVRPMLHAIGQVRTEYVELAPAKRFLRACGISFRETECAFCKCKKRVRGTFFCHAVSANRAALRA